MRQRGAGMAGGDGSGWRVPAWPDDFDALYRAEYPPLVRLAALLVGSKAVAEEVVQDAFVRSRSALAGTERPAAYLRVAVVNGCRSVHRRRAVALVHVPRRGLLPAAAEPELRELADVLAMLPARQRQVLVLRYYADCTESEIAELLGCQPGTVKSLAHRGLSRMRALLQADER